MKKWTIAGFIALFIASMFFDTGSAYWYTGNKFIGSIYGGYAYISTSPNVLHIGNGHIYSWIGTPGAVGQQGWLQAGWGLNPTSTVPYKYTEYCHDGCINQTVTYYEIDPFGSQNWGTTVYYKVAWQNGSTDIWCAYIDNLTQFCKHIISPPVGEIQALSEVQDNSAAELDSVFDNVYYQDATLAFQPFSQENWVPAPPPVPVGFPYQLQVYSPWHFRTYGFGNRIYLPLIIKS